MPLKRSNPIFNKSHRSAVHRCEIIQVHVSVESELGQLASGVAVETAPQSKLAAEVYRSISVEIRIQRAESSRSRSICKSTVGGRNDALVASLMEPLVFQRMESSASRLVPGRLEYFWR